MKRPNVVIIGGGLSGLAAGIYAQLNGFVTTILEHNLALGGVCAAWKREPYTVDGCIHWLTCGPFERLYRELGIVPKVPLQTLSHFTTYRHVGTKVTVPFTADFVALKSELTALGPEDGAELERLLSAAASFADIDPGFERPHELRHFGDMLRTAWELRSDLGDFVHFRKPFRAYAEEHLTSPALRAALQGLVGGDLPAIMLVFLLGYLHRGFLSRPVGGTAAFRDALVEGYRSLGGTVQVHTTVDEILVRDHSVCGVQLSDGTQLDADVVISTSSAPETVLRLLGGRYGADALRKRLETWKLFEPIVLVTFGVERGLADLPTMLLLDGVAPFDVGGREVSHLYLRIFNDEPSVAPAGHTVVQALLPSTYEYWAMRGDAYQTSKERLARRVLASIETYVPEIRDAVRMIDVSTPLTFWHSTRSWRGAYEGWMPNQESFFGHVDKRLPGLSGLYMAGQWVEPGGGVPTALLSGRQAVQLLCDAEEIPFQVPNVSWLA